MDSEQIVQLPSQAGPNLQSTPTTTAALPETVKSAEETKYVSWTTVEIYSARALHKLIQESSPVHLDDYCDLKVHELYFPSLDVQDPHGAYLGTGNRFDYIRGGVKETETEDRVWRDGIKKFVFMGRQQVRTIHDMIAPDSSEHQTLEISGGSGNGKSHVLAALAVHFMANGRKVLYVPDCTKLKYDFAVTVASAVALMIPNFDPDVLERLLETTDKVSFDKQIMDLVYGIYQRDCRPPIFIFDQFDSLDDEQACSRLNSYTIYATCIISMSADILDSASAGYKRLAFSNGLDFSEDFTMACKI